jgi:hypothetical protein
MNQLHLTQSQCQKGVIDIQEENKTTAGVEDDN